MTSTKTTKINGYPKVMVVLAVLASLVAMLAANPARADGELIFKVNGPADLPDRNVGDGVCDADLAVGNACTLRAAIQESNATQEKEIIAFDIPEGFLDPTTGVATISPKLALPTITEPVAINGYSQPGASPNTATKGTNAVPKIVLSGTNAQSFAQGMDGLSISAGQTMIRGLVINGFRKDQNFSGGTAIKLLNVAGNTDNAIVGNFIGTDARGTTAVPNQGFGVEAFSGSTNNTIGGTAPADRNLISGNSLSGISLSSNNNTVQNNLIGTDESGTKDLGNGFYGVGVFGSNNLIGGGSPNAIAFNGASGVDIEGTSSVVNRVLSNSVFSNGGPGIDLDGDGASANDPGDTDEGANHLQNYPVVTSAKTSSIATTVKGTLNSQFNSPYILQFFSNPTGTNEGKKLIGEKVVPTDASGNVTFTFKPNKKVAVGQTITATATRNVFGIPTDTSEFSTPRKVAAS